MPDISEKVMMNPETQEVSFERIERTPANSWCLVLTFFAVLFTIAGGGIIVYWLAKNHGMALGLTALRNVIPPREEPVPGVWKINDTYLIPFHRGVGARDRLGFAVADHLESIYKHNGIEQKLIGPNEYLELSQASVASAIEAFCKAHKDSKYCANGVDENVFWTDHVDKAVVIPESAEDAGVHENPLLVSVGAVETAAGLSEVKRMLLYSSRPLILSFPRLRKKMWLVCEEGSTVDACAQRVFECGNESWCYARVFDIDSEWFDSDVSETVLSERTLVSLVGYNNNFVHHGYEGGLIIKNNWGAVGHTLEFLLGKLPVDLDRKLCPNPRDSTQWVPATWECASTAKNVTQCSTDLQIMYGDIRQGAVRLACVDAAYCDKDAVYVLERENGTASVVVDWLTRPSVIELKDKSIRRFTLNLPLEFAWHAFTPVEVRNETLLACGYVMLPYSLMKLVTGMQYQGFSAWRVYDVQLDWDEQSYPGHDGFNYEFVKNSTKRIEDWNSRLWDDYSREIL